jgi:hypothetical protein
MEEHNLPYRVKAKEDGLASQKLKTFATILDHRLDNSVNLQHNMLRSLSLKI